MPAFSMTDVVDLQPRFGVAHRQQRTGKREQEDMSKAANVHGIPRRTQQAGEQ
jgi:hypothetical protein